MESFSSVENANEQSKREVFSIEVFGEKLEVTKEEFTYSEKIQNETKIEGYTKYKINQHDIENFLEDIIDKKFPESKKVEGHRGFYMDRKVDQEINHIYKELCEKLSDSNFPDKTYNHVIQADGDYFDEYHKQMYEDNFILGKLENISPNMNSVKFRFSKSALVITNDLGEVSFVGDIRIQDGENYTLSKLLDTKNTHPNIGNDVRLVAKFEHFKTMSPEEFSEFTKDKIICSTMSGIYTQYGDLFGNINRNYNESGCPRPIFGFDSEDPIFKQYIEKVKELYSKIPPEIISDKNIRGLDHLLLNPEKKYKTGFVEEILPVMTGDTDLPQMRWGHAKYAIIPTEKNFNFLVINHTK